jgi:excisionase family DNA binding protein
MGKLMTVPEVAEELSVTEETVRRWLRSGKLKGSLLSRKAGWRVRPEAIDEMLTQRLEHMYPGKEPPAA